MCKLFKLVTIFLLLIGLSVNLQAQERYYYSSGKKIYFSSVPDHYVVNFKKGISSDQKKAFFSNKKIFVDENLLQPENENIIVEITDHSRKEIKGFSASPIVKLVTDLYHLPNSNKKFTITDYIVAKFYPNVSNSQINQLISDYQLSKIEKEWLGERVYLFSVNSSDENLTIEIANQIYQSELVEFSHPDFICFDVAQTNDDYYSIQWNLSKISISDAWNVTTGSPSIIIAITDNGVDSNHDDLKDNLVEGYNVLEPSELPEPTGDYYHGTAVAGIASASTNNNCGIAGVGYNCKIMPIKCYVLVGKPSDGAAAINWAWQHGADVINCSWGCSETDVVTNAINSATSSGRGNKGCIVVVAAGNDGTVEYPATLPNVIAVGMTDQNDNRISGSGSGAELDVMAPGWVCATDIMGSAGKVSGDYIVNDFKWTSAAAPHVSGLAGLILSVDNSLTEQQVRAIIQYTADDKGSEGWDQDYGWGRVDAGKAVKTAARQFTISGQLTEDEFWWGSITLTNNVTVPAGIKLTILSDAYVNFNGHTLTSSGGTISFVKGGIIKLNTATYVDITGTGSTTYEVNGINVGTTFNGIGQSIKANPPSGYGMSEWSDCVGGNYRVINSNVNVCPNLKLFTKPT
jgi:subtilisin family serine protease